MRIRRQKPSAQRWFLFFGLIGSAIAGARKRGSLRFEIPYCADCRRRERILLWATWGSFLLSMVFICGFAMVASQAEETSDPASVLGILGTLSGAVALLIAAPVLGLAWRAHQAVHVKRIHERSESVLLAFRSRPYFEQFLRENVARIVSFALGFGKPVPVPPGEAIAAVSQQSDVQHPRSADSLKGYFERGQLYVQAERYGEALADLDWVVGVTDLENPYFLEAQFFRGQTHMRLGKKAHAETDLGNYVRAASDRARVRQARRWLKQLSRA